MAQGDTAAPILPALPRGDLSHWSGLANYLKSAGFRTVREYVDPGFPLSTPLPPWLSSFGSLANIGLASGSYPSGGYRVDTDGTNGGAAGVKMQNPSGTPATQTIQPNLFGAIALTLEGLAFSANNSSGFDFQMGFPGNPQAIGGCALWHPNGQPAAEIRTGNAAGTATSKTPRRITDAVLVKGSKTLQSAAAAFVDADAGDRKQPLDMLGNGGLFVPSNVVASIDSAGQAQMSLPSLVDGSGKTVSIGQSTGVAPTSLIRQDLNITLLWWTQAQVAQIWCDDQCMGTIDLKRVPNYSYNSPVVCQWQIVAKTAAVFSMFWKQAKITFAHN